MEAYRSHLTMVLTGKYVAETGSCWGEKVLEKPG